MAVHRIRDPESLQALVDAMLLIEADLDLATVLQRIVEQAVELVGARYGALGVLDRTGDAVAEFVTVGIDEAGRKAIGTLPTGKGVLGLLIRDPDPLRLADLRDHAEAAGFPSHHPPMESFLGVPVRVRGEVYGNLYLCDKQGAPEFTQNDEDLVTGLGLAAGLVIDKARVYQWLRELTLVQERERIARNLHDTVIQRLFAAGLRLQGVAADSDPSETAARVHDVIDDLDETIREIRTTIFAISSKRGKEDLGLRRRILDLTDEVGGRLGLDVRVQLEGPLDTVVPDLTADHLILALREALANVVRHAEADHADVHVAAVDDRVILTVRDDGIGVDLDAMSVGRGLANLQERAKLLHGVCFLRPRPDGGTELVWQAGSANVPVAGSAGDG
jgi:signal transduction histidine kinase